MRLQDLHDPWRMARRPSRAGLLLGWALLLGAVLPVWAGDDSLPGESGGGPALRVEPARTPEAGPAPAPAPAPGSAGVPSVAAGEGPGVTIRKSPLDATPLPVLSSRAVVKLSVHAGRLAAPAGAEVPVAVVFDHAKGFHVHTQEPKLPADVAAKAQVRPTRIKVLRTSPGLSGHEGFIAWPKPHVIQFGLVGEPFPYEVFEGRAIAYLPVTLDAQARPGPAELVLEVRYQACDERSCKFEAVDEAVIRFEVLAAGAAAPPSLGDEELFRGFPLEVWGKLRAGVRAPQQVKFDAFGVSFAVDVSGGAGVALLLVVAALGGMLLNLTPCVLPVIPLKILGLSHSAGNPRRCFALGLTLSLGVLGFWLGLGVAIATVSDFTSTNQLFQKPWFPIAVGVVIAAMAVGMCGLFAVRLPMWVYAINPKHDSYPGSLGFGVMTAVLSTPCTAPFMGAAAAWAATQRWPVTLAVFASIGAGMALPYAVLSAFPSLVNRMPKTGPASELLKQVMGGLMLAAAAFFIGSGLSGATVAPPDPPSLLYWWFVFGIVALVGGWLAWRTFALTRSPGRRLVFAGAGAVLLLAAPALAMRITDRGPIRWTYYTPERFEQARASGDAVVLDFTAEWCLNCKSLEAGVLHRDEVASLLNAPGVRPIKVDLTGKNRDGNERLRATGRVAIPLLVIYGRDGSEVFKSDFYTKEQVIQALRRATGP